MWPVSTYVLQAPTGFILEHKDSNYSRIQLSVAQVTLTYLHHLQNLISFCEGWTQSHWFSELTPRFALRNHTWKGSGTICGAED